MAEQAQKSDEQQIRDLVQHWMKIANDPKTTKEEKAKGVLQLYSDKATLLWPGMVAKHGPKEIGDELLKLFGLPGLRLKFEPERILVDACADMATECGVFTYQYDDKPIPDKKYTRRVFEVVDKYLVVWRKLDGTWKVLYDCYNSNEGH